VLQEQFSRHQRAVSLVMNDHYLRHLVQVYRLFEGDLVQAMVLGEVAHHNLSALRTDAPSLQELSARLQDPGEFRARLIPTNAFSIAQATGIPRETVRRKVAALVKKGWLFQDADANLIVTAQANAELGPGNLTVVGRILDLADDLQTLLVPSTE
jgi:hypothetical protein